MSSDRLPRRPGHAVAAPSPATPIPLAALAIALLAALATPAGAAEPAAPAQTVVITGNPLRSAQTATPASVLTGDELVLRRGSSLGDTLDGLPGVSASYFGPNASRPIIRGQDGDRIRLLSNAGASLDASGLSFDHAVPIDPLVVERVEVLRGPAALLYGGAAVGGVVNTIDNRIPSQPMEPGVHGAVEARVGGAAAERGLSALVETGGPGFALHADAFARRTSDLRVPAYDRPDAAGGSTRETRVLNSASDARGGAIGGALQWDSGYLGASVDSYRNDYGIVAEDDVTIQMRRDRLALAGEWRTLGRPFSTVRVQAAFADYQHQEVEGSGEVGTTFKNRGGDGRLEAVHADLPLGGGTLSGVLGLQAESARFEALGEEAFVPATRTRQTALFAVEQWRGGAGLQLSAGLRLERVGVDSEGDADPAEPRFGGPKQRRFSPYSASLGAVWALGGGWDLSANAAATQRAPTSYELYADGVHAATASYERGDPDQAIERGRQVDLGLQWRGGADGRSRVSASVFWSRFSNYIALLKSGEPDFIDEDGGAVPVYVFQGTPARLMGLEAEAGHRIWAGAADRTLDLSGRLDLVRGDNLGSGEPLPRLAPLRLTLALDGRLGDWGWRAELQHAARQDRVPSDDVATDGWTMLNLSGSVRLRPGAGTDALAFLTLRNVGDAKAYSATTAATVRPLSPLPGRGLMAGLRLSY